MKTNKKILFLILLAVILTPAFCSAADKTLNDIVTTASDQLKLLSGGLATIAFIIAGIMFLTATGNPSRMQIAKGALIAAVIGIVVLVLAVSAKGFVSTFFGL